MEKIPDLYPGFFLLIPRFTVIDYQSGQKIACRWLFSGK